MKVLFFGLGSIGQRHLRALKHIAPDAKIGAVRVKGSSPTLTANNEVMQNVELNELYSIEIFSTLKEGFLWGPEIVFVTNPTSLHAEIAIAAVKSGASVLVEKPAAESVYSVKKIIDATERYNNPRCYCGFQFRFHPALKAVKELLNSGSLGNIVAARFINGEYLPNWHKYEDYRISYAARKELGGGVLLSQIHDFDYAQWLLGKPNRIVAFGGKLSSLELDVEDSVAILADIPHGNPLGSFPAVITLDYLTATPKRKITIVGDKKTIECDLRKNEIRVSRATDDEIQVIKYPNFNRDILFRNQAKALLTSDPQITSSLVPISEALISQELVEATKRSLALRQIVLVD